MSQLTDIKRQIAALEAKAARLIETEMKASVAKVKSLMDSLGVTVEQLGAKSSSAVKRVVGKTAAKNTAEKRSGAGVSKYRDPATGQTWSGFGRAPAWIALAKNRDKFLVSPTEHAGAEEAPAKSAVVKKAAATKTAASKKAATKRSAAKKAATKSAAAISSAAKKAVAKKAAAKEAVPAAKKAAARKAPAKKTAAARKRSAKPEAGSSVPPPGADSSAQA